MLTPEQIIERKKGIGSSDAAKIMTGSDEVWFDLWREKTGRYEPPPILDPWNALLRHHIEPAMMDFYETAYSCTVIRRGEAVISEEFPILRATLDGANMAEPRLIDAKLLNIFTPDPVSWATEKYAWQMVHQMTVCQVPNASLYVSLGMKKPDRLDFEYNEFEAMEYVDRCLQFWDYVVRDVEPPGAPAAVAAPMPVDKMRVVDMSSSNAWGQWAGEWLENQKAASRFKAAEKEIKELVEADVRDASGFGVRAVRDGRGLSVKAIKS